jgi:hypothetical protein
MIVKKLLFSLPAIVTITLAITMLSCSVVHSSEVKAAKQGTHN